jgi:hypothetical protein
LKNNSLKGFDVAPQEGAEKGRKLMSLPLTSDESSNLLGRNIEQALIERGE